MISSSFSGTCSPRSPVELTRSDNQGHKLSAAQRSSRIGPHIRSASCSTASEQGRRGQHAFELEQDDLFFGTSSSSIQHTSSTDGASPKSGRSPITTARHGHPSRRKVRGINAIDPGSPSASSCSEAPESPGGTTSLRYQTASARCNQPHQPPYELPFAARNPVFPAADIQVPLVAPASPVFPSSPFPLASSSRAAQCPRTPERRRPVAITSQTSLSSLGSSASSSRVHTYNTGLATPSYSPQTRKSASNSSTPSPRPPSILIRQALVPARGPPTLAMSMQIHAPSPITSSSPISPTNRRQSRSHSRPTSPLSPTTMLPSTATQPGMPRPPSRSERLLRDTLRKVEEYDRMMALSTLPTPGLFGAQQPAHGYMSPPPPGGRRSRRATSSSTTTDASLESFAYCDTGACYSDDEEVYDDADSAQWLQRSSSGSSSSSGHSLTLPLPHHSRAQPPLPRHQSDNHDTRRRGYTDSSGFTSPSSPSPARAHLQRSARSASSATRPTHASSQSASRSSVDAGRGLPMHTPHSAVLHSRLEGVLRGVKDAERARSRERDYSGGSGSSNSLASSRNMSVEGEWYFAPKEQAAFPATSGMESPSHTRTRSRGNTTSNSTFRSPRSTNAQLPANVKGPSHHVLDPLTPPPTPPFNALTAAAQCKAMDGYVSFTNIEGLGIPDGEDDSDEDEARRNGKWLKWFHLGQPKQGRNHNDGAIAR